MIAGTVSDVRTYRVAHMCCGIGAGAKGFNDAQPRVGNIRARFECAGGIDVDARGLVEFEKLTGAPGAHIDLFDEEQYRAFHGKAPPAGWRAAIPEDIWQAYGARPTDVLFASFPCKGFSGLLSAKVAGTDKYEALNRLTVRGLWLALEANKHRPIRIILFENVPRIRTRGRKLLDKIQALLRSYGYVFVESEHDCGEIGGLGQSRRRFLLVARHPDTVPNFIYQPEKKRLRGDGEIIGKLPLPMDPIAGALHNVPRLQWKTWVRLAFVPAGKDWRALNDLVIEDGVLRDYGIVPDQQLRDNALGVNGWADTAPLITGARAPGQGRFSVADPRTGNMHNEGLGVRQWTDPARVVAAATRPANGAHSVADPRPGYPAGTHHNILSVIDAGKPTKTIGGARHPAGGALSVADPRVENGHPRSVQLGVGAWDHPAAVVKGDVSVGTGRYAVSDPRIPGRPRFNNVFRIVPFVEPSPAVAGPGGPAGGLAVADPRPAASDYSSRKYQVTRYGDASRTVIGASSTGDGAFAVADPRGGEDPDKLQGNWSVGEWAEPSRAVVGARKSGAAAVADPRGGPDAKLLHGKHRVEEWDGAPSRAVIAGRENGAYAVQDPRPVCLNRDGRDGYATQGHYGVQAWTGTSGAIPAYVKHDRGAWAIADPRVPPADELTKLPAPDERLVARIIALDATWHRPFTTLELAALQSIVDPEEAFGWSAERGWFSRRPFDLGDGSDVMKREWIGNAVPSEAARGMAEEIGEALLLADMGESFALSSRAIWVSPVAFALAIDPRQNVCGEII